MLIAIVAADRNWGIGKDDALLAHIPEDMRFFREHTTGHPVIMGRKTLESFPGGRPLKNRKNIVISRRPGYAVEGAVVVSSVEAAIAEAGGEDAYVIGGGSVYRQLIDYCELAYVTKIDAEFEADTYFPDLDADPRWELAEEGEAKEHEGLTFRFTTYRAVGAKVVPAFRELQRKKRQLPAEECIEILKSQLRGVLSVAGDSGYPYGMPINHYYREEDGRLYFHSGMTGHKVDALRRCDKASFCVYDEGFRREGEWALNIRSVIVFGRIEFVEDRDTIYRIARELSYKFTDDEDYIAKEIERSGPKTLMFALVPEHICGKIVNEA